MTIVHSTTRDKSATYEYQNFLSIFQCADQEIMVTQYNYQNQKFIQCPSLELKSQISRFLTIRVQNSTLIAVVQTQSNDSKIFELFTCDLTAEHLQLASTNLKFPCDIQILCKSDNHVAIGFNNKLVIYEIQSASKIKEFELDSQVTQIQIGTQLIFAISTYKSVYGFTKQLILTNTEPHLQPLMANKASDMRVSYRDIQPYGEQFYLLNADGKTVILNADLGVSKWQKINETVREATTTFVSELQIICFDAGVFKLNNSKSLAFRGKYQLPGGKIVNAHVFREQILFIQENGHLTALNPVFDEKDKIFNVKILAQIQGMYCTSLHAFSSLFFSSNQQISKFTNEQPLSCQIKNAIQVKIKEDSAVSIHHTVDCVDQSILPDSCKTRFCLHLFLFQTSSSQYFYIDIPSEPVALDYLLNNDELILLVQGVKNQLVYLKISTVSGTSTIKNMQVLSTRFALDSLDSAYILDTKYNLQRVFFSNSQIIQLQHINNLYEVLEFTFYSGHLFIVLNQNAKDGLICNLFVYSTTQFRVVDKIVISSGSEWKSVPLRVRVHNATDYFGTQICAVFDHQVHVQNVTGEVIFQTPIWSEEAVIFSGKLAIKLQDSVKIIQFEHEEIQNVESVEEQNEQNMEDTNQQEQIQEEENVPDSKVDSESIKMSVADVQNASSAITVQHEPLELSEQNELLETENLDLQTDDFTVETPSPIKNKLEALESEGKVLFQVKSPKCVEEIVLTQEETKLKGQKLEFKVVEQQSSKLEHNPSLHQIAGLNPEPLKQPDQSHSKSIPLEKAPQMPVIVPPNSTHIDSHLYQNNQSNLTNQQSNSQNQSPFQPTPVQLQNSPPKSSLKIQNLSESNANKYNNYAQEPMTLNSKTNPAADLCLEIRSFQRSLNQKLILIEDQDNLEETKPMIEKELKLLTNTIQRIQTIYGIDNNDLGMTLKGLQEVLMGMTRK
ncbi:Conserved_hypothetical protein [Hexamita inflata]|uniref:Uncharacterized protein n=2 Tax=Hexamita inflata TaxID=28002 RepID=A0AA86TN12_9EUKA|nr:Conserved hypothetical protein [Hexamita inflata]